MYLAKMSYFAVVGCGGFIVDSMLFYLCYQIIGLELMTARVIAFFFAASTTWIGNRLITFRNAERSHKFIQWQKFIATASISAIPNFLFFRLVSELLSEQEYGVYLALFAGVLAGMLGNFLLCERWVFRH